MAMLEQKEINALISSKRVIELGGLKVHVKVNSYKYSYGRHRYLVTPVAGTGEVWVESITPIEQ